MMDSGRIRIQIREDFYNYEKHKISKVWDFLFGCVCFVDGCVMRC